MTATSASRVSRSSHRGESRNVALPRGTGEIRESFATLSILLGAFMLMKERNVLPPLSHATRNQVLILGGGDALVKRRIACSPAEVVETAAWREPLLQCAGADMSVGPQMEIRLKLGAETGAGRRRDRA